MNNICNIFNKIDKENGNFLLFSQYVEDLSKSVYDATYKIRPSKFICMNLDGVPQATARSYYTATGSDEYVENIPGFFQNIFEDGITALKNCGDVVTPRLFSMNFINSLNTVTSNNLDKYIVYIGDVDSASWENGFADIILSISSGSSPCTADEKESKPIATLKSLDNVVGTNGSYYIQGWKDATGLSISPITSDKVSVPSAWTHQQEYADDQTPAYDEFLTITTDNSTTQFTFNTIVIFYDILDPNDSPIYKGIPMGIYFTGAGESTGIGNEVTIYKSSKDAYGAGSGWSLRICTRFSSAPYGYLKVEEISLDPNIIPESISRVLGAAAETIQEVRKFADESIYNSQGFRDLTNLVKDGKMNVPYIRAVTNYVNGQAVTTNYWFVNGRNTEVPA